MVGVSASFNLPLHHKVQKFFFWHRLTGVVPEKGHNSVVVWCGGITAAKNECKMKLVVVYIA